MTSRLRVAMGAAALACAALSPMALADWTAPATTISAVASNPLVPVGTSTGMSMAMDRDGVVTATWAQAGPGEANDSAYSARMVDGHWSAPVQISSAGAGIVRPHVAVGPSGNPLVTWERGAFGARSVQAVRYAGGRWGDEATIAPVGANGSDAFVAADGADTAMALWTFTSGANTYVRSSRYAGGAWSAPADLPGAGSQTFAAGVTAGAPGQVTAAWDDGSGTAVATATSTNGTWGSVTSYPAVVSSRPEVALNSAGNGAMVWAVAPGVVHAARRAGGAWGADQAVSPITDVASRAVVAVDDTGVATVAWVKDVGTGHVVQVARSTDSGWSAPVDISSIELDPAAVDLAIAAGATGQVTVVWSGQQGGLDVMRAATRTAAGWGAPAIISGPIAGEASDTLTPFQVAIDPLGRATAAWLWNTGGGFNRVRAARLQGVPNAPTSPSGTAGNASVEVRFAAPADDGSSAISGYRVTATPGGATCVTNTTTCRVSGLTNGTAYTFTVAATNAVGTGPESAATTAVRPAGTTPPRVVGALKATMTIKRRVITTTGSVAKGVTRVTQRATAKGKKARTGTCRILAAPRTGANRPYRCTMKMVPASRWTITTESRNAGGVLARNVRTMRVR